MPHTPGPWTWTKTESWWGLDGADGSQVMDDGSVANEFSRSIDPEGDERNQANARLIAAAPELLEACKECERLLTENGDPMSGDDQDAMHRIRAAIAKAEQEGK